MRLKFKTLFIIVFLLVFPITCLAKPYYGFNFSYALITKEPPTLHGYQFRASYDPNCLKWRRFNLYVDAEIAHFWITSTPYYSNLNIYSLSPVVRYTFKTIGVIHPYLELSIGLAYLNHTRLDDRNLGIHFSFQDRAGIGIYLGSAQQFSIGIHAVHYSNAHLSEHNSGVTVPLLLDVGYRFQ